MKPFEPILISENNFTAEEFIKIEREKLAVKSKFPALLKPFNLDAGEAEKLSWNELDAKIKDTFQFKNASDDFNLDAVGLKQAYNDLKEFFTKYQWTLSTEPLTAERIEAIKESNRIYTTNEKQNEAHALAQSLTADLLRAKELGLIPTVQDLFHYRSVFHIAQFTGEMEIDIAQLSNILINLK